MHSVPGNNVTPVLFAEQRRYWSKFRQQLVQAERSTLIDKFQLYDADVGKGTAKMSMLSNPQVVAVFYIRESSVSVISFRAKELDNSCLPHMVVRSMVKPCPSYLVPILDSIRAASGDHCNPESVQ